MHEKRNDLLNNNNYLIVAITRHKISDLASSGRECPTIHSRILVNSLLKMENLAGIIITCFRLF